MTSTRRPPRLGPHAGGVGPPERKRTQLDGQTGERKLGRYEGEGGAWGQWREEGEADWEWQESIVQAVLGDTPAPYSSRPQSPAREQAHAHAHAQAQAQSHTPPPQQAWGHRGGSRGPGRPGGHGDGDRHRGGHRHNADRDTQRDRERDRDRDRDASRGRRGTGRGWRGGMKGRGMGRPMMLDKSKIDPEPLDEHRLNQRQKQIDYGKNTIGYDRYVRTISREQRGSDDPQTPDKYAAVSKRTFDAMVRGWRRALHKWDPDDQTHGMDSDEVVAMDRLDGMASPWDVADELEGGWDGHGEWDDGRGDDLNTCLYGPMHSGPASPF